MKTISNSMPFGGTFPLWFVVAGDIIDIDVANGRRRIRSVEPRAFSFSVVGGQLSVLVFTDEQLARRHARHVPGAVPWNVASFRELTDILRPLHPKYFASDVIDPQDKQCTRMSAQKTIPEFISSFQAHVRTPSRH